MHKLPASFTSVKDAMAEGDLGLRIADLERRRAEGRAKKHRAWGMGHGVKDKRGDEFLQSTKRRALMQLTGGNEKAFNGALGIISNH